MMVLDDIPHPAEQRGPRQSRRNGVGPGKSLPHSIDAEQGVLGAVILRPEVLEQLAFLEVDDFYDPRNRAVFAAMRNLESRAEPIDPIMLEAELDKIGKLGIVGGMGYLGELALRVPTPENAVHYANIIREHHLGRLLLLRTSEAQQLLYDADSKPDEVGRELIGDVERVIDLPVHSDPGTWDASMLTAARDVARALGSFVTIKDRTPLFSADGVDLLTRQYDDTQWLVQGLITVGGVAMLGAEPKAFKTWLGTEICVAVATGTPVCGKFFARHGAAAYFYAEDLERQVRNRVRALLAGADRRLERGRLHVCPRGKFIDITRDRDLAWLIASARKLGPIDLLVLDPLRDISSASEDKSDEMGPVMRRLRLVGEILRCTVGVVHHAGKATVDTAKRRPGQRLRGSGAIHGSIDSGIYLSDTESDDPTVIKNAVDTEIKGARSAGSFDLEMRLEDDEHGEAIKATWTVTQVSKAERKRQVAEAKEKQRDSKIDQQIVAAVRSGAGNKSQICDLVSGRKQTVMKAVDGLLERAELVFRDGAIAVPNGGFK